MDRIVLSKHIKHGDTFYTPLTDPSGLGDRLKLSSWSNCWLPEYYWIGMILHHNGREKGLPVFYNIMKELNKNKIAVPQMSKIFTLKQEEQVLFWEIVTRFVDNSVLAPLAVVFTPDINEFFYDRFFQFSMDIDNCISLLLEVAKKCLNFHDELTTDICFIVDWFYVIKGTLYIANQSDIFVQALANYHKHSHTDEEMRMYRPMIRSTFQAVNSTDGSIDFSGHFWNTLGRISKCKPITIEWGGISSMEYYKLATDVMEFISVSNEHQKMETKYCVSMRMVCYIYKLYREIVEKKLQNEISGRIIFRTMAETYINLKYLINQETEVPDIFERYKAYGYGKYKLVVAKIREGKFSLPIHSQIDEKYTESMVNEYMDESFINISIGFFDKTNVKTKFSKCGEEELYEIYYEYATNYSHGMWGAIRESSMLLCDNPIHEYHVIPDYLGNQNIRSVLNDCEMILQKAFIVISTFIDLPDFYTEFMEKKHND